MSYRLKLAVTITLLIAAAFGIGGTWLISTSFQETLAQETQAALTSFESIQNVLYLLNSLGEQTDLSNLADSLTQMEQQGPDQWQALQLQAQEKLLFRSGNPQMTDYTLPEPGEGQCSCLSVSDNYGCGLVVSSNIPAGNQTLSLVARFDMSHIYALRQAQQEQYLVIYSVVVLVGFLASAVLSHALTGKLRRLTATVRRISGGDLSRRSQLDTGDEFGQLSRDFDDMADKLQANIRRMEETMEQQEQFMGAFAHELKTPMTSIIGFADLLRQGDMDENTRMMAADYIYSEGRRLERLSFKLLELLLLKKDKVTMKRVQLPAYLAQIERALAPNMKNKGIRFVCRAEPGYAVLEPDLVKSLLYNLADNAAKAMDGGGIVAVFATQIPDGCQFQVVDNGNGMAPEELERITEAFYRVDKARARSQGGAGLGLALCKRIAQVHNGTIRFESTPGKGTRVTAQLYGKGAHGHD